MSKVNFKHGSWANYNKIANKDENTLYFITDKNLIFKGSVAFGNVVGVEASGSGESEVKTFTLTNADGTAVTFSVPTSAALSAVKAVLAPLSHTTVKGTANTLGHVTVSDSTDSASSASDSVAASPLAVKNALAAAKTYADGILAANDAMVFKGTLGLQADGGSVQSLPSAGYSAGWTYKVVSAGTYAGVVCEVGDLVIATKDYTTVNASTTDWIAIQTNIDGAVTAADTLDADAIVLGNGSKVVKALAVGDVGQYLTLTKDANSHVVPTWTNLPTAVNPNNLSAAVPVSKGGTGATTAADARTNLGLGTAAVKDVASTVAQDGTDLPTAGAVYTAIQSAAAAAAAEWVELT